MHKTSSMQELPSTGAHRESLQNAQAVLLRAHGLSIALAGVLLVRPKALGVRLQSYRDIGMQNYFGPRPWEL